MFSVEKMAILRRADTDEESSSQGSGDGAVRIRQS